MNSLNQGAGIVFQNVVRANPKPSKFHARPTRGQVERKSVTCFTEGTTPAREARLEDWELLAGLLPANPSGRRICGWQIGGCRSDGRRRIDRLSMVITAPGGFEIGRRLVEV